MSPMSNDQRCPKCGMSMRYHKGGPRSIWWPKLEDFGLFALFIGGFFLGEWLYSIGIHI